MSEIKEIKTKEKNNCNCNTKNEYLWKWFFRCLVLATFIMCCILTHYLLKLWGVWQVVERMPKP